MKKYTIRKVLTRLFIIVFILSFPILGRSEEKLETLIILKDTYTFEELEGFGFKNMNIGLMNIKSRKPYTKDLYYYSLNLGRKVGYEDLKKDRKGFQFLGDIFKDEIVSINGIVEEITPIVEDSKGNFKNKTIKEDILKKPNILDDIYKENKVIVLKVNDDISSKKIKTFIEYNNEKGRRIYLLPENSQSKGLFELNKYFTPMGIIDNSSGILTSKSTNRKGIIAIEDISTDIKSKYGKEISKDIGKEIIVMENDNPMGEIKDIYKESLEMHYITFFFHGLFYFSQFLILYKIIFKRKNKCIDRFLIFANINIMTSFIPGLFKYNIFKYLIITTLCSGIITYIISKKKFKISKIIAIFYPIIVLTIFLKPKLIYKSFMGYNNLIYGARFYGINNGMASILLGSSIFLIDEIRFKNIRKRNFIIFGIGLLNILLLSTKFGSNTGGFFTSIVLFLLINYYYIKDESKNQKLVFILAAISLVVIGVVFYNMGKFNDNSHGIKFIKRVKQNGLYEFYYMVSFKLKELIKLTLMPPFSLVLLSQGYILSKLYKQDKGVLLIILIGLIGYTINDTGYEFLIYLLNFGILKLYFNKSLEEE